MEEPGFSSRSMVPGTQPDSGGNRASSYWRHFLATPTPPGGIIHIPRSMRLARQLPRGCDDSQGSLRVCVTWWGSQSSRGAAEWETLI